ncbi:MAG: dockerin type I domain-containing protein [Pirellulales bacterium]
MCRRAAFFVAFGFAISLSIAVGGLARADQVVRVADLAPGPSGSGISFMTEYDGSLYFRANGDPGTSNAELWRFDGTTTSIAAEINPGPSGSSPAYLAVYDDALYFSARGPTGPPVLWRFDGTTAAPAPGGASQAQNPEDLFVHNGQLLYRAFRSNIGLELWRYDGANQTPLDLWPGSGSALPKEFVAYHGDIYMNAVNQEWWRLNASATGATQVSDIANGNGSSPEVPVVFDGEIYFRANDRVHGLELWRFDGTTATLAADIVPGDATSSSYPSGLTVFNDALYFAADNGIDGSELWRFDGTAATMIANINERPQLPGVDPVHHSNPSDFRVFGDRLYFSADDGIHGRELFRFDGTQVEMVADIWPGEIGSEVSDLTEFQGSLYFQANDGQLGGELNQLREGIFRLSLSSPNPRQRIAYTNFDEPLLGSGDYTSATGSAELGFHTNTTATTGIDPMAAVASTSTTPTTPVLGHKSIAATTTLDAVDLTGWSDVIVNLMMQVRATTYEAEDFLRVFVTDGISELNLVDLHGAAGDDPLDDLAGDGYLAYSTAIPDDWATATLVISSSSNSSQGAERYDFDSIEFLGLLSTATPGDLNGDGRVDRADAAMLARNFGISGGATLADGDFNGDAAVTLADLAILQGHFTGLSVGSSASLAVPEPAAWQLFGVMALLLGWRSRVGRPSRH